MHGVILHQMDKTPPHVIIAMIAKRMGRYSVIQNMTLQYISLKQIFIDLSVFLSVNLNLFIVLSVKKFPIKIPGLVTKATIETNTYYML